MDGFLDWDFDPVSERPSGLPRIPKWYRRNPYLLPLAPLAAETAELIPLEIVEVILHHLCHLPESKPTLASCSLVCKAWHARSRYLLFEKSTLYLGNCSEKSQFLKDGLNPPQGFDPSLSAKRYLQNILVIHPNHNHPRCGVEQIFRNLHTEGFIALQSLELDGRNWLNSPSGVDSIIPLLRHSNLQRISNLELRTVTFAGVRELVDLASVFANLERLVLWSYTIKTTENLPHSLTPLSSTLKTLHLMSYSPSFPGRKSNIPSLLLALQGLTSPLPTTLSIGTTASYGLDINDCLEQLGDHLIYLSAPLVRGSQLPNLSKHPNLRQLELNYIDLHSPETRPVTTLDNILQTITSRQLKILMINLKIHTLDTLDYLNWANLLQILNGPRFSRLEKLVFSVPTALFEATEYISHALREFRAPIEVKQWVRSGGVSQIDPLP